MQPIATIRDFGGGRSIWLAFQNMVLRISLHSLGQSGLFIQEEK